MDIAVNCQKTVLDVKRKRKSANYSLVSSEQLQQIDWLVSRYITSNIQEFILQVVHGTWISLVDLQSGNAYSTSMTSFRYIWQQTEKLQLLEQRVGLHFLSHQFFFLLRVCHPTWKLLLLCLSISLINKYNLAHFCITKSLTSMHHFEHFWKGSNHIQIDTQFDQYKRQCKQEQPVV